MSDEVGGASGTKPASGGQGQSGGEGTTTIRPLITAVEV